MGSLPFAPSPRSSEGLPERAGAVIDGRVSLNDAYAEVQRITNADTCDKRRFRDLSASRPDLAEMVSEGTMTLDPPTKAGG
jgi:hypothetical protein